MNIYNNIKGNPRDKFSNKKMSQPLFERQPERILTRPVRQQTSATLNCIVCRTNIPVSIYENKSICQCTSRLRQDSESTVIIIKPVRD